MHTPFEFPNHSTIQFFHDSNGNWRIFPEANTCKVILHLPLHPSYSIFTKYMESGIPVSNLWVNLSPSEGEMFSCFLLSCLARSGGFHLVVQVVLPHHQCGTIALCLFVGLMLIVVPCLCHYCIFLGGQARGAEGTHMQA